MHHYGVFTLSETENDFCSDADEMIQSSQSHWLLLAILSVSLHTQKSFSVSLSVKHHKANSKFHLIQSLVQISVHMSIFSMLNWMVKWNTVNMKFHVIQTFQHKVNLK